MMDRFGQQVGNYRILRLLGEGGFAQVYLGEHLHLGTQAAIKILSTRLSQEDMEQFRAEARIIARLEHPYIIRVLDFGLVEKTPYLVMSYAPNGTLRQLYPQGTRLPLTAVLQYISQTAQALQYAHTQRIIHRDIKPENILLGRSREALLSDFGIALVSQTSRSQVTANVVGTVAYMAPEQIQGKPGQASDQYALGVIAYEWITGERPFRGSFTEIAVQQAVAPPPPLRSKLSDLSPDLERVILTALHKEPQQRFLNVQAFATALERAITQMNQEMMPTLLSNHTPGPVSLQSQPVVTPTVLATPHRKEHIPPQRSLETPRNIVGHSEGISSTMQSGKVGTSRRAAMVLLGAIGASAVLGGGLTWFFLTHQHSSPSPMGLTPPTVSKPKPTTPSTAGSPTIQSSIGTTLNVYRGHTLYIYGVTWASSDGQRIASASDDQTVQDWGAYTNQRYFSYRQNGPINDVKASHGKTRLASAGEDHTVQIRDAQNGTLISIYTGHTGAVYTVEWSPDDQYIVTASADKTVRVWEVISGNVITLYSQHTNVVWSADWSPDGQSIVSTSMDTTARVWEAMSGTTLQVYTGHTATVRSVSWSTQNYGIATASEDLTVQVWNPQTGKTLQTYRGHTAALRTVDWAHASSRIVSGSHDATAQIWDGANGQHIFTYRGHSAPVFDAQWSADDKRIVSGSTDTTAQIWQAS